MGPTRALDGEGTAPTDRAAGTPGGLSAGGIAGVLPADLQVVGQTAEEVAALSVVGYFGVAIFAALMLIWFWFRT